MERAILQELIGEGAFQAGCEPVGSIVKRVMEHQVPFGVALRHDPLVPPFHQTGVSAGRNGEFKFGLDAAGASPSKMNTRPRPVGLYTACRLQVFRPLRWIV
jgi:hypothetical protein